MAVWNVTIDKETFKVKEAETLKVKMSGVPCTLEGSFYDVAITFHTPYGKVASRGMPGMNLTLEGHKVTVTKA
jgi:hypothetical protein